MSEYDNTSEISYALLFEPAKKNRKFATKKIWGKIQLYILKTFAKNVQK